jgi:hypothetical protein
VVCHAKGRMTIIGNVLDNVMEYFTPWLSKDNIFTPFLYLLPLHLVPKDTTMALDDSTLSLYQCSSIYFQACSLQNDFFYNREFQIIYFCHLVYEILSKMLCQWSYYYYVFFQRIATTELI